MFVTAIKADGYKNLENVFIEPHPKYNLIIGMNAQGKTNLLESIWLMTGCRSFRNSRERDYIGIDRDLMEIGIKFDDGRRIQSVSYLMARDNIRSKNIRLNGVQLKGTNRLFDSFKAVVFTPDDVELIKGNPEKRRSFTDLCCCQLNNSCMDLVRRYDLLINHRNNLLKAIASGNEKRDLLNVWDRQVAAAGSLLSKKRNEYIIKLAGTCSLLYSMITDGSEKLSIEYNSNIYGNKIGDTDDEEKLFSYYFRKLEKNIDDDIRLGYTAGGAHRDDIIIKINGLNVREFGSQGQKKTAALVMKLGQAEIYYKNKKEAPVILLDDVMGELDENRQRLVFDIIRDMQVFITTCNEKSVSGLSEGAVFKVKNGKVMRE
ncbi:MAG: DNA replication/repair protein RecF [Porcipelethomonas sp.]